MVDVKVFQLLRVVATEKAAAVAAPYLFNVETASPRHGDALGDVNFILAANALGGMKLRDAPTTFGEPEEYRAMDFTALLLGRSGL